MFRFLKKPGIIFLITAGIFLSGCGINRILSDRVRSPVIENGTVKFRLYSPAARSVYVAGEFNDWNFRPDQEKAIPLQETESNIWTTEVEISPGRYQYKFVVNQRSWILDPANPDIYRDATGNENSLLIVR